MTIKTNYFDGNSYAAVDAVAPWAALLTDGIFGTSSGDLNVLAHSPANLSVDIQPGQGLKNGYFFNSDSIVNVPIPANTSGYNRIDLIVANVDITNKATTFTTVQGTPSSSPTAPLPNANQLVLAQVYVGNNVSVINQSNVTDVRQNVDLFGNQVAGKANLNDATMVDLIATGLLNGAYANKTDGNGAGIFNRDNSLIILYAVDTGTPTSYILAIGYKNTNAVPILNVIKSNVLTLGASNTQGTQVINGGNATYITAYGISIRR